jgi:hypothetical protein
MIGDGNVMSRTAQRGLQSNVTAHLPCYLVAVSLEQLNEFVTREITR